jgi:succinoglycan biosynthesis transport protein ExoP
MSASLEPVPGGREIRAADSYPARLRGSADNYGYGYRFPTEDRKTLADYWRAILNHIWLVVGLVLLSTAATIVYMARQPDIFEARARVQVDVEDNSGYGAAPKGGSIVVNSSNDPIYFNTQLQILSSAGLLRRVARTLDLEHDQGFTRPPATQVKSTWQNVLHMFRLDATPKPDKSRSPNEIPRASSIFPALSDDDLSDAAHLEGQVGVLMRGLTIDPVKETRTSVKETRLIDISYAHLDPLVAAKISNTVADVYVRSNLEKKTSNGALAGSFLQQRISDLRNEIRDGEERLMSYGKDHKILSLDANQNMVVDRLAGLNRQLLEAENERALKEAAYRASLAPGAGDALADKEANLAAQAETKLADLRQKRAQLLVTDTEKMPEVQEIDKQIAVLEQQKKESRSRAVSVLTTNRETEYRQAVAREQDLRSSFEKQRAETITQNEAAINYKIIQQEIDTNKSLLEGLLQKSKENDVMLAGVANNVHVIDYAAVPRGPVSPQRWQTVGLALILSMVAGIALALMLDYLDNGLHTADELERVLHLPALAVIPTIKGAKRKRSLAPATTALTISRSHLFDDHPELILGGDERSPLAEAFRHMRTTVLLSTPGRAPRTLLVTSSVPSEGKTTSAINTAHILTQTGATVLLIDADMRHPRLHQLFGIENEAGLSTILASEKSESELAEYMTRFDSTNLYILTAGPLPANPADLLGSDQMITLLAKLSKTFDHVVIDSPPVNYFTDSVLISSAVDGVLLVVHGGTSSRQIVQRAKKCLQDVGAKIFGIVLNQAKTNTPETYYYNG